MNRHLFVLAAALCLLLCFGFIVTEEAMAQGGGSLAEREGLQAREIDASKLPGKLEVGLALGSTIAMFAVYKYL